MQYNVRQRFVSHRFCSYFAFELIERNQFHCTNFAEGKFHADRRTDIVIYETAHSMCNVSIRFVFTFGPIRLGAGRRKSVIRLANVITTFVSNAAAAGWLADWSATHDEYRQVSFYIRTYTRALRYTTYTRIVRVKVDV